MTNEYEFPLRAESPLEDDDGEPVIWENPDVPPLDDIANGDVTEFFCPYDSCGDDFNIDGIGDDPEENREALLTVIDQADGTWRCDECGEPVYGFYANGDHDE